MEVSRLVKFVLRTDEPQPQYVRIEMGRTNRVESPLDATRFDDPLDAIGMVSTAESRCGCPVHIVRQEFWIEMKIIWPE